MTDHPEGIECVVRLPNGVNVYGLHEEDTLTVYRDIFDDDCYHRHDIAIKDGDCILDVGANTGLFILYLNAICRNAHVYAFEPLPAIFNVLEQNVAAHNHLDVHLFNVGMSRRPGTAVFSYYSRFSNASTMYPDDSARSARMGREFLINKIHTLPWPLPFLLSRIPSSLQHRIAEPVRRHFLQSEEVTCRLWTLSRFLREQRVPRIDLLKIDAERSEADILAGLDRRDWPKVRQVIVEVHDGVDATRGIRQQLEREGFRTAVDPNPALPGLSLVYATRSHR